MVLQLKNLKNSKNSNFLHGKCTRWKNHLKFQFTSQKKTKFEKSIEKHLLFLEFRMQSTKKNVKRNSLNNKQCKKLSKIPRSMKKNYKNVHFFVFYTQNKETKSFKKQKKKLENITKIPFSSLKKTQNCKEIYSSKNNKIWNKIIEKVCKKVNYCFQVVKW